MKPVAVDDRSQDVSTDGQTPTTQVTENTAGHDLDAKVSHDQQQVTALSLLWVSAHLYLRRIGVARALPPAAQAALWQHVHDLTRALGNPPAPYERTR